MRDRVCQPLAPVSAHTLLDAHMSIQKEVKIDVTLICQSLGEGKGLKQELVLDLGYLPELQAFCSLSR